MAARGFITAKPAPVEPMAWNITRAALRLGVKPTWLRDKVTAEAVPFTRLGKHVRFTEDHLRQILAAGEFQPKASKR